MISKQYLALAQKDVKRRFKSYKRGGMQGLPMVWNNIMEELKRQHLRTLK